MRATWQMVVPPALCRCRKYGFRVSRPRATPRAAAAAAAAAEMAPQPGPPTKRQRGNDVSAFLANIRQCWCSLSS